MQRFSYIHVISVSNFTLGVLNEGLTGDGSILVTKAILNCVTSCIFAAPLGKIIPCLYTPQLCAYLILFGVAHIVQNTITDVMIADSSAVGGIVTFVAGLRLLIYSHNMGTSPRKNVQ